MEHSLISNNKEYLIHTLDKSQWKLVLKLFCILTMVTVIQFYTCN